MDYNQKHVAFKFSDLKKIVSLWSRTQSIFVNISQT